MVIIVKLIIFVIFCEFCISANVGDKMQEKPNLKKKRYLSDALDVFTRCGGWGQEIKNMTQYESIKEHCYLTMRFDVLCCIEKPNCPDGMIPEIPVVLNMLYPIQTLELGCIVDKKNSLVRHFCQESDESFSIPEPSNGDDETSKKKTMWIVKKILEKKKKKT